MRCGGRATVRARGRSCTTAARGTTSRPELLTVTTRGASILLAMGTVPADAVVRALTGADWDAVRRVYAEGIATGNATFETEVPTREALEATWLAGHRWVAEVDGEVAGWAAAKPVSTRAVYAGVAETSVYVGEGFRGRGVGRALLEQQVTAADAGGLWTLQTAIFPENRASLALHHAFGFRTLTTRERIGRHHGVWRDTVLLERRRSAELDALLDPPAGPP